MRVGKASDSATLIGNSVGHISKALDHSGNVRFIGTMSGDTETAPHVGQGGDRRPARRQSGGARFKGKSDHLAVAATAHTTIGYRDGAHKRAQSLKGVTRRVLSSTTTTGAVLAPQNCSLVHCTREDGPLT